MNFDKEFYSKEKTYFTLSFVYIVQSENESLYFAYDEPYSYSEDYMEYIQKLNNERRYSNFLQINTLCHSLAGVECKMMTITDNINLNHTYFELLQLFHKRGIRERMLIK